MSKTIELKDKILKNKQTFLEKNELYGILNKELLDYLGEEEQVMADSGYEGEEKVITPIEGSYEDFTENEKRYNR